MRKRIKNIGYTIILFTFLCQPLSWPCQGAADSLRTRALEERKEPDLLLLRKFLPADVVNAIRDSHGGSVDLLELQKKAIEAGILDPSREEFNHNAILEGPTSAGKTDPAFWKALALYFSAKKAAEASGGELQGRYRCVFLEPSKALCAERKRAFSEICEKFGIRIRVSNSDDSHDDADILRGDFDILICTNEKLSYFMQGNKDFLGGLGIAVVDELETLNEEERGAYLETVTHLVDYHRNVVSQARGLSKGPVMLGLSVPLKGLDKFARKIDADVISVSRRPISVRIGIWRPDEQAFSPFDSNTGELYEPKKMPLGDPTDKENFLRELILQCKGFRIMLAVPTRGMVRECCQILTELCRKDPQVRDAVTTFLDKSAVEGELSGLEDTANRALLAESLQFGIGAHEASFREGERSVVEKLFRDGAISIVVSTATLEKGINVSADAVIFYGWGAGPEDNIFAYVDEWLTDKILNWIGRAGRVGQAIQSGQPPFAMYVAGCGGLTAAALLDECERVNSALIGETGSELHTQLGRGPLGRNIMLASSLLEPFSLNDMVGFFASIPAAEEVSQRASLRRRVPMEVVYLVDPEKGAPFLAVRRIIYSTLKSADPDVHYPMQLPRRVEVRRADLERLLFSMAQLCRMEGFPERAKDAVRSLGRELRKAVRRAALRAMPQEVRGEELTRICKEEVDRIVSPRTKNLRDARFERLSQLESASLEESGVMTMHRLLGLLGTASATDYFLKPAEDTGAIGEKPRYLKITQTGGREPRFELTPYGRICSSFGVSTATAARLYSWAMSQETQRLEEGLHLLDILNLLLQTDDGFYIERLGTGILDLGEERALLDIRGIFANFQRGTQLSTRIPDTNINMLVKLCAMAGWVEGMPFRVEGEGDEMARLVKEREGIEGLLELRSGSLDKVSADFARLCRAFVRICRAMAVDCVNMDERRQALESFAGRLEDLADRLQYGLPQEAIPIARLGVKVLTRGWIMKLFKALPPSNQDLPILERLNMFDVAGLEKMGIPRGLASDLKDALEKNQAVPLAQNLRDRPWLIPALLLLPQVKESHLEQGKRRITGSASHYTALRVLTRDRTHVVWRRNDPKSHQPIELNAATYDEMAARGACEFLAETAEAVPPDRHLTDHYFVDFDPRNGYSEESLKNLIWRAVLSLLNLPETAKVRVTCTGGTGYHLEAYFAKNVAPKDIEAVKAALEKKLSQAICNPKDVFLKQDPTNISPYVFVDLSPNMKRGVYRNLYSLHPTKGGVKVLAFEIEKGRPAELQKMFEGFKAFDAAEETTPEVIIQRFRSELSPAQKQAHAATVAKAMGVFVPVANRWLADIDGMSPAPVLGRVSPEPTANAEAI